MSFKDIEQVKFELNNARTWGVKKDKFEGYSIPVVVDEETKAKVKSLAKEHNTKNPIYVSTLYLKSKGLNVKQKKELFNKGKSHLTVHFKATGTYTKGDVNYLVFRVTKLCKIEKPESEDECPMD